MAGFLPCPRWLKIIVRFFSLCVWWFCPRAIAPSHISTTVSFPSAAVIGAFISHISSPTFSQDLLSSTRSSYSSPPSRPFQNPVRSQSSPQMPCTVFTRQWLHIIHPCLCQCCNRISLHSFLENNNPTSWPVALSLIPHLIAPVQPYWSALAVMPSLPSPPKWVQSPDRLLCHLLVLRAIHQNLHQLCLNNLYGEVTRISLQHSYTPKVKKDLLIDFIEWTCTYYNPIIRMSYTFSNW